MDNGEVRSSDGDGSVEDRWERSPNAQIAAVRATPHSVLSHIYTPEMAAFLPRGSVAVPTQPDEQGCVDAMKFTNTRVMITPDDVRYCAQFPHLTALDVGGHISRCGGSPVNAASLAAIAKALPELKELNLSCCNFVNAVGVAELTRLRLQKLNVGWCPSVDAAALAEVAKMTNLRELRLVSCDAVNALTLVEIGKSLTQLRFLDLSGFVHAPRLHDEFFKRR